MSKEAVSAADAAAGLQILAEVIERGLNIVERDCEVFGRPVPTGAEIQMMVRRQDVLDIRAVLSERDAHVQAVEALRLLVHKMDTLAGPIGEMTLYADLHGRPWTAGNWSEEMEAVRAALAAVDEGGGGGA